MKSYCIDGDSQQRCFNLIERFNANEAAWREDILKRLEVALKKRSKTPKDRLPGVVPMKQRRRSQGDAGRNVGKSSWGSDSGGSEVVRWTQKLATKGTRGTKGIST